MSEREDVTAGDAKAGIAGPPIVLTAEDRDRILALLDSGVADARIRDFLRRELERADIVASAVAARTLVSMGSVVTFVDHAGRRVRRVRLVYPDQAGDPGSVSVLSTIGSALLGLGPGQSIVCSDQGVERRLVVLDVEGRDGSSAGIQAASGETR
jgi:regulator of nucleoside diphosphate kinase